MDRVGEIKKELRRLESLLKDCTKTAEKAQNTFNRKNKYGMELDDFKAQYEGLVWGKEADNRSTMLKHTICANLGIDSQADFESYYKVAQFVESAETYWTNQTRINQFNDKIAKLQSELDGFNAQKADAEQKSLGLREMLEQAMSEFKTVWFERMEEWHRYIYNDVKERTPYARDWAHRYKKFYYDKMGYRFFRRHPVLESRFELKAKSCAELMANPANRYSDIESYIQKVIEDLEMDWQINMRVLVEKCSKFNVDQSQVRVTKPMVTPKGFQALITDGKPRVIDVRMIWAARQSKLVKPHTRYIITERKTR